MAAELAQIDHSTLGLWLTRGERSSSESRFAKFRAELLAAEAEPHTPKLLPLRETPPRLVNAAWKFLERAEWMLPEPEPPVQVRVTFSDGTPIGGTYD